MTSPAPTDRPTIGGIVVNYNYDRYVGEAIRSLLTQTASFDEVIVVDDGSTDGSLEVIRSFSDDVTVVTKENGGQLSAVLAAVDRSSTDYVYVLDADDAALPTLVERIRPLLDDAPTKVQFQLRSMDSAGAPIDSVFPTYRDGYDSEAMIRDNALLGFYVCPPTSGNVFRRSYLADVAEHDLDLREAFDGVLAQAAPYFGAVVSLNEPLVHYRVHDASDSGWGRPTPALLRVETERFEARWSEVSELLAVRGIAAAIPRRSAYVTERQLMIAALEGRHPSPTTLVSFVRRVVSSGLSTPQRVALSSWAVAVAILPQARAAKLVVDRRSSAKRGRLAGAVARLVRRSSR